MGNRSHHRLQARCRSVISVPRSPVSGISLFSHVRSLGYLLPDCWVSFHWNCDHSLLSLCPSNKTVVYMMVWCVDCQAGATSVPWTNYCSVGPEAVVVPAHPAPWGPACCHFAATRKPKAREGANQPIARQLAQSNYQNEKFEEPRGLPAFDFQHANKPTGL